MPGPTYRSRNPFRFNTELGRFQRSQLRLVHETNRGQELDDIERSFRPSPSPTGRFLDRFADVRGPFTAERSFPTATLAPQAPQTREEALRQTGFGQGGILDRVSRAPRGALEAVETGMEFLQRTPLAGGPFAETGGTSAVSDAGRVYERYVDPSQALILQSLRAARTGQVAPTGIGEAGITQPSPEQTGERPFVNPIAAAWGNEEEQARAQQVLGEAGVTGYAIRFLLDPLNLVPVVGVTKADDLIQAIRGVGRLTGPARARAVTALKESATFKSAVNVARSEIGGTAVENIPRRAALFRESRALELRAQELTNERFGFGTSLDDAARRDPEIAGLVDRATQVRNEIADLSTERGGGRIRKPAPEGALPSDGATGRRAAIQQRLTEIDQSLEGKVVRRDISAEAHNVLQRERRNLEFALEFPVPHAPGFPEWSPEAAKFLGRQIDDLTVSRADAIARLRGGAVVNVADVAEAAQYERVIPKRTDKGAFKRFQEVEAARRNVTMQPPATRPPSRTLDRPLPAEARGEPLPSEGGAAPPGRPPVEPPTAAAGQPIDPAEKMTIFMQENRVNFARSLKERKRIISAERTRRAGLVSGAYKRADLTPEEQFRVATKSLGGEMETTSFGKPPLEPDEVQGMLARIRDFPLFQRRVYDARNAQGAFLKLTGGVQPTKSEWRLLEKVFGPEFVKAGADIPQSQWRVLAEVAGLPRTMRTILDLSWSLRQGIGVTARHPVESLGNIPRGIKALFSQKTFDQWDEAIRLKPRKVEIIGDDGIPQTWGVGELQDEAGLFLPKMEEITSDLAERTEEFLPTQGDTWVGKVFGPIVKPFQRNFTGMGNGVRSDIFENTIKGWTTHGRTATMEDARGLAWLLNVATGRGDLSGWNRYAAFLAQPIFSPRLVAARIEHTLSPGLLATGAFGVPRSGKAAALAAQELVSFVGAGIAILGVASAAGLTVETNPLSSKWGKIEIPIPGSKQTHKVDLFGGYQQYARTIAQLLTAKRKTDSGEIIPADRKKIALSFARNKLSPLAAMGVDVTTGESGIGEKVDLESEWGARTFLWNGFSPLALKDIAEATKEDGLRGFGIAGVSIFGTGVQTYGPTASSQLYEIPEFTGGISANDISDIRDFYREVDKVRDEWRAEGQPVDDLSYEQSIRYIAELEGKDENWIEWAVNLNKPSVQDRLRNPEWLQFIVEHEGELREQRPTLFSRNDIIDAIRETR